MKILASRKLFKRSFLKKPTRVLLFVVLMILFCGFLLLFAEAGFINQKTEQTLEKERSKQSKQSVVAFSRVRLNSHPDKNVRIIQNTKNVRSFTHFQNSIFAATDGGLLQISENGEILRHFTVLDGLPESDLTSLAVFQSKLFIGTKSQGMLSFDGEIFESYRLQNHETKSITTFFSDDRALLIGTFSGGLLEFDGVSLREIKAVEERLENLTFLQEDDLQLLAGTFDKGLWIRKNQIWKHFTTADGLLSNRIISAKIMGKNLFVATDLGISQAFLSDILPEGQKIFRQTVSLPTLSSLIVENTNFYITKDNGEISTFSLAGDFSKISNLQKINWKKPDNLRSAKLFKANDEIWFLSSQGVWKNSSKNLDEIALESFNQISDENVITDNNASALAIDRNERLWIGTFRNGIDVFSPNGKKLKHIESEMVREINFLTQSIDNKEILAATSGGAIRFDASLKETVFNDKTDLPSSSATQISSIKKDKNIISATSTAKGLFVKDANSKRVYSSINGLPGNSIFSTLFVETSLYVGTLGGLAQIENGRVVRVFKTSNSDLKNNWINALCRANDRIFIGTYGGGIYELLPSGEIHSFEKEAGMVFINPNAMFSDGERLFAGTLNGVWMLNLSTQKWSNIKDILPSETVLSITGSDENIYFGTTGGIAEVNKKFWIEN